MRDPKRPSFRFGDASVQPITRAERYMEVSTAVMRRVRNGAGCSRNEIAAVNEFCAYYDAQFAARLLIAVPRRPIAIASRKPLVV